MPVNIRIEAILPKDKNLPLSIMDDIEIGLFDLLLDDIGPEISEEYQKQVKGWSRPPLFPVRPVGSFSRGVARRPKIGVEIIPKGKGITNWIRVNKGTGPRRIMSRGRGPMVFPRDYDPKTTPGGKYGGPGRKSGDIVRTHLVRRHRIEPRNFEDKIVTQARIRNIKVRVQRVIDTVVRKHS